VSVATVAPNLRAAGLIEVTDAAGARAFRAAAAHVYRRDPCWVPPLPGEERQTFDSRRNPSLDGVAARRWVLLKDGRPAGRIAAFAPSHRPGIGYVGFFESPDDPAAARTLLDTALEWLAALGRRECYGPIAVTPRDRIGLLLDGFDRPPMLFTPYNPPYYARLLESAGWEPCHRLSAYGWVPTQGDRRGLADLARRSADRSRIRIRPVKLPQLAEETRRIARLVNETLAEAWHYDPISDREAADMAALLRPMLDPSLALIAEDDDGPCAAALGVPDVNWLWHRAGGRLWPAGWLRLLRWRKHVPQGRLMALGLAARVRGTGLAARLIDQLHRAAVSRGYARGELSQVYHDNTAMIRILDRAGFHRVREYAVFTRRTTD
jgi:ribosomal protein S18 acetylase RimI-like enzyme